MKPKKFKIGSTPAELDMEIVSISIDMTERCNLRCEYCFADLVAGEKGCKTEKGSNDLTLEMGKEIIDWFMRDDVSGKANERRLNAKTNQPYKIDLWGGEPLMNFDLVRNLIDYGNTKAHECGKTILWGGTTNVTLLTADKVGWLLSKNVHFLLSVDGIGERNRMRKFPDGSSSWEVIEKNMKAIHDEYFDVNLPAPHVRLTPTPGNLKGMAKDIIAFYEMGFKTIFFSENYDADWTEEDYAQYEKELEEISDFRLSLIEKGEEFMFSKYIDDCAKYIINSSSAGMKVAMNFGGRACGAGNTFLGVSIEGALYPCHRFNKHNTLDKEWHDKKVCVGSIFEGITNKEFLDYLTTSAVPAVLGERSALPHCKDCDLDMICLGGCYAVKYDHDGTISNTAGDVICRVRKLVYKIAMREIMNTLSRRLFGRYIKLFGIGFFNQGMSGKFMPDCTCNLAAYLSRAEHIEHLVTIGKYHNDDPVQKDTISLIVAVKKVVDFEINNLSKGATSQGCVCNSGQYNRDLFLKQTAFADEFTHKILGAFLDYWEHRNE